MMGYEWHDLIGNLGMLCVLGAYLLLQFEKLSPLGLRFPALNAAGSGMIVYSLTFDFNLSAFALEVAWLIVSLLSLTRIYLRQRRA